MAAPPVFIIAFLLAGWLPAGVLLVAPATAAAAADEARGRSPTQAPPDQPESPASGQPMASQVERALAAYEAGDIDTAQQLFLEAGRGGNALAAYNAAVVRLNDESAEPEEKAALDLLVQSAGAGFAPAQHMLAALYERGQFLPPSQSLAVHWYRLAAEQGDPAAQLSLATQYYLGRGAQRDYGEAARWYERAAQAGDAGAQYIVASMYEQGLGVQADLDQALGWYTAAARQGDVVAELKAKEVVQRMAAERGQ
jgi:uncharacterized protein